MLERIALHHTRLHTPGLGVDAKGVALGSKGLVLVPSIDRLVALLAAYTREHSLADIMPSLSMHVAKSKLGTREITVEFSAESSDRMDRIAETARLVGGYTFTGTSRHFVQYRDAAAPFGYDARQLLSTDAALALYHDRFSQTYDLERRIELRSLLLRLMPTPNPSAPIEPGLRIVVAEQGLGPALLNYFVRSRVDGEVCVAEWSADTTFSDAPIRRWIMRIPELPDRMRPLVRTTPGISLFVPAGPGVGVEAGYVHPVALRACPVFDPAGLVLLRGGGGEPWIVERLPAMGSLASLGRIEMRTSGGDAAVAERVLRADVVRVPLRISPSSGPRRNVTATWIPPEQWPLLRRLAYALPPATIAEAQLATTDRGVFLRSKAGIEAIPLGTYFSQVHPNLYVPAGYDVTPAVSPEVLARALGAPSSLVLFLGIDARAWAIEESAFAPLEAALVRAPPWEPVIARAVEHALDEPLIELKTTAIGLRPLRGVEPPPEES
jgi:hypothetical protein